MLKQLLGLILLVSSVFAHASESVTETKEYNGLFWHAKVSQTTTTENQASHKMTFMIEFINRKNQHSLAKFINATTSGGIAKDEKHVIGYVKNKQGKEVNSLLSYVFIPQLKDDGSIDLHYLIGTVPDDNNTDVNDILVQGEMTVHLHKNYVIHLNDLVDAHFSIN